MKKHIFLYACMLLFLGSCDQQFLEKEPFDKLVPSSFFSSEAELDLYANSFYLDFAPSAMEIATADGVADYSAINVSDRFMAGSFSPVDQAAWSWTKLRNVNYFLQHYNNNAQLVPLAARNHYAGIARFFRAYFYFDMVKNYGDVPWYSTPLSTSSPDLYKGRDPRAVVMDSVLADLNFAVAHIRDTKDNSSSTITKWVALGLKSRICLFEGTFRKNHTNLGLQNTAGTWLREAANAADEVMKSKHYTLHSTGNPAQDYRTLFVSENPVAGEVMWANVYNNALRRWHPVTWNFNQATIGSRWSLTKPFINTYLNRDGSRFTDQKGFNEKVFIDEMANRDPRLAQTVRSLGYKRSDGTPAPPNFGYTLTGYNIMKFSLDDKSLDTKGESYNSVSIMRYAEILLNYAEAKAELGEFNSNDWNLTIGALRKRAGVAENEPTVADHYLQDQFFPEISDKYLLEIRRERGTELVYEGFRFADLLRWKKGRLIEKPWEGIYVPGLDVEMDLDGNGTPDVSFVKASPAKPTAGVYYKIVDGISAKLSEGDKGFIIWNANEKREFSDKKYYRPISNADLVLNPNLGQNPGW
jgi:hypothetical protein